MIPIHQHLHVHWHGRALQCLALSALSDPHQRPFATLAQLDTIEHADDLPSLTIALKVVLAQKAVHSHHLH